MGHYLHRTVDFLGVTAPVLRDSSLLSGLLIAAAGAAGFSSSFGSTVHERVTGSTAMLVLDGDGCHVAAHAFPDRELLLLDLLVPEGRDTDKAIDVFVRKLNAKSVRRNEVRRA